MNNLFDYIKSLSTESKEILNIIQKRGPIDKNTLMKMTAHKTTRFNRYMNPIEECGIIVKIGEGNSTGGRKPILYDVNINGFFIINLAIATAQFTISINNLKAKCMAGRTFPMNKEYTPEQYFKIAISTINELTQKLSITPDMLIGAGLSAFGAIDREEGKISKQSVMYLNEKWIGAPLVKMFSDELGLPVIMDVGVNSEMLSHYLYGKDFGVGKFLYLSSAMSIRTAFMSGSKIIRSTHNCDDAFGHMMVNFGGERCKCGNFGCIECYSAIPAIVNSFIVRVKLGRITIVQKPVEDIEFVDIAKAADAGDPLACEVINYAASILGCGLANYINLLNPDIVLLSGIIAKNCNLFCDVVIKTAFSRLNNLFGKVDVKIIRNDYSMEIPTICGGVTFIETMLSGIV